MPTIDSNDDENNERENIPPPPLATPVLIPPRQSYQQQQRRKTVVLDLDETLVHSTSTCTRNICDHIRICFHLDNNTMGNLFIHLRPWTLPFLSCCHDMNLDIVIYSAGKSAYVRAVVYEIFRTLDFKPVAIVTFEDMPYYIIPSIRNPITGVINRHKTRVLTKRVKDLIVILEKKFNHSVTTAELFIIDDNSQNFMEVEDKSLVYFIQKWYVPLRISTRTLRDALSTVIVDYDMHLWLAWVYIAEYFNLSTLPEYQLCVTQAVDKYSPSVDLLPSYEERVVVFTKSGPCQQANVVKPIPIKI